MRLLVVTLGIAMTIHAVLGHQAAHAQAGSIPLTGEAPIKGVRHLVTSGIPFPRRAVTDLRQLRLEDAGGTEVPAQFTQLTPWPDGSVKSLLLSTVVETGKNYVLRYGPGVTRSADPAIAVDETTDQLTVNTGAAVFVISKQRFSLLERVDIGGNTIVSGPVETVLKNRDGQIYRSAAYRGDRHKVVVEDAGPVRVVVRVSGLHASSSGRAFPVESLVRMTFLAGERAVRLTHTLIDQHETLNERVRSNPALALDGYWLEVPYALGSNQSVRFGAQEPQRIHEARVTGRVHLYQSGQFALPPDRGIGPFRYSGSEASMEGARAAGWMVVGDAAQSVGVFVRHFWEQFPKELAVDGARLEIGLHPVRAVDEIGIQTRELPDRFYSFWPGIAKTYDVSLHFLEGTPAPATLSALSALMQERPLLKAPPAWYARSGVFGFLSASSDDGEAAFDAQMAENIRRAVQGRSGFPRAFGERHFGDMIHERSQWNNHHYDQAAAFTTMFLRTGRREYLDLAEIHARHHYDVNVMHVSVRRGDRIVFHRGHNHTHYGGDLHNASRWHPGHTHLGGGAGFYLLTGDDRAREVLVEQWEHMAWRWGGPPRPRTGPRRNEAERDHGYPLGLVMQAYRATGERTHLELAARMVQNLIDWWQEKWWHVRGLRKGISADDAVRVRALTGVELRPGKGDGPAAIKVLETQNEEAIGLVFQDPRRLDWTQGTGYWWMHPRCDNCPLGYNGANPWMAGVLLSNLIDFLEADRDHGLIDAGLLRDMIIQTTTHVVTFGWEDRQGYFVYSEAWRGRGSSFSLTMPMLYVTRVLLPEDDPRRKEWLKILERLHPPRAKGSPGGGQGNPYCCNPVGGTARYFGLRTQLGLQ